MWSKNNAAPLASHSSDAARTAICEGGLKSVGASTRLNVNKIGSSPLLPVIHRRDEPATRPTRELRAVVYRVKKISRGTEGWCGAINRGGRFATV